MRAYFFTNMYLSSIQQGIQPLHVVADMFVKYMDHGSNGIIIATSKLDLVHKWARDHKTVICLNGGYTSNLHDLVVRLDVADNPYPWQAFWEGDDALGGVMTSVGIILPEKIYETVQEKRDHQRTVRWQSNTLGEWQLRWGEDQNGTHRGITVWEKDFIDEMSKYGLAK